MRACERRYIDSKSRGAHGQSHEHYTFGSAPRGVRAVRNTHKERRRSLVRSPNAIIALTRAPGQMTLRFRRLVPPIGSSPHMHITHQSAYIRIQTFTMPKYTERAPKMALCCETRSFLPDHNSLVIVLLLWVTLGLAACTMRTLIQKLPRARRR